MYKKSILTIITILCALALLVGCNSKTTQNQIKDGLKINTWSSALGSVSNTDLDNTKFSYSVYLTNENTKNMFIKSIEPIVNETIKDKILSKEILVTVNRDIKANETIEVSGEIIINTKGLTKSEIQNLSPFITDIKIVSEETLSLRK